jgi:hypothetical protein
VGGRGLDARPRQTRRKEQEKEGNVSTFGGVVRSRRDGADETEGLAMSQCAFFVLSARLLALCLTAVLFVACSNTRTTPHMIDADSSGLQPTIEDKDAVVVGIARDFDVGRYKAVVVDRFTVADPRLEDEEDKQLADIASGYLQGEFVRRLKESGLFEAVVAPGDGLPAGTTLKLTGSIAEVQGGSRHVRYWIGFAAGRSKVEIHTRLLDAETGKPVVVTAVRRLHALSEDRPSDYGRSNEDLVKDALRDSAEDYVRFLARLARGQAPRAQ